MKLLIAGVGLFAVCCSLLSFKPGNKPNGKQLFTANCAMCHRADRPAVGPPFQGIRRDYKMNWIRAFVCNGDSMSVSDDIRAAYIFEVYNKMQPHRFCLDDEALNAVLDYTDSLPITDTSFYRHRKMDDAQLQQTLTWLQRPDQDLDQRNKTLDSLKYK